MNTKDASHSDAPRSSKWKTKFPARLHVLLAREAKVGLVIRRGPTRSVCTVLWDRERDTFTLGQWLRGKIFERRSDLSPDGKHFIYFAMNGRWESETEGSWTAVSRVPYLKAIDLFPWGDCWFGGGLFLSNREFWLNGGHGNKILKQSSELCCNSNWRPKDYSGWWEGVYYNRMQWDGWMKHDQKYQDAVLFEKKLPASWVLRRLFFEGNEHQEGRAFHWDAHELRHEPSGTILAFPEWEWADFVDGRLVYAVEGKLCSAQLEHGKIAGEKLLHDFNDMKFEAIAAPY